MQRFLLILLVSTALGLPLSAQKKQVSIRIVQDEAFVLDNYISEITLKRKAFRIQVLLAGVEGIYTFAGFTDSICCKLGEKDSIPRFALFPDITMAEPDFNKEKELLVGEKEDLETPLYLFFVAVDEVDTAGRPSKELMRRKVRINWRDED